jgi:hypothetical protein
MMVDRKETVVVESLADQMGGHLVEMMAAYNGDLKGFEDGLFDG